VLNRLPKPVLFAHRGASVYAPENTMAAFHLAEQQGANAIELDVKLSADGQVVVIHDPMVDRTTDGTGRVSALSLAALKELDAGAFFSEQYRGERIPTLDDIFAVFGKRLFINVELSNYTTARDNLVESVVELVNRHGLHEWILFSSFFPWNLSKVARLLSDVPRGLLAPPGLLGSWSRSFGFAFGSYQALHPHMKDVSPEQVQRVHRLKRRIHVWTVNAAHDIRSLMDWGVDGIMTDDPILSSKILGRKA